MNPIVKLTATELMIGAMVACIRMIQNVTKGIPGGQGVDNNSVGWQINIEGALGELVVAKYLNKYWNGNIGDKKAADVGNFQVRTQPNYRNKYGNHLYCKKGDPDNDIFILVIGSAPIYEIAGWIKGCNAKQEIYWADKFNNGRPNYFVPESELKPINQLIRLQEVIQ